MASLPGRSEQSKPVSIFVFSHNDEASISSFLGGLDDCLCRCAAELPTVEVILLANGCRDRTAEVARQCFAEFRSGCGVAIEMIDRGGKANAWNHAVHHCLAAKERNSQELAVFMDSDIDLSETDLHELLETLQQEPNSLAVTSRPRKKRESFSFSRLVPFVLSRSDGPHHDGVICGQLYAARISALRKIQMPRDLLVEDGFLAACLRTRLFSIEPDDRLILAHQSVHHFYEVEQSLSGAIRHEARTELGSHINFVGFPQLWETEDAGKYLADRYQENPDWLIEDFNAAVHQRGHRLFLWHRIFEAFGSLKKGLQMPISFSIACLRALQRGIALQRAYSLAVSGVLKW